MEVDQLFRTTFSLPELDQKGTRISAANDRLIENGPTNSSTSLSALTSLGFLSAFITISRNVDGSMEWRIVDVDTEGQGMGILNIKWTYHLVNAAAFC